MHYNNVRMWTECQILHSYSSATSLPTDDNFVHNLRIHLICFGRRILTGPYNGFIYRCVIFILYFFVILYSFISFSFYGYGLF